MVSRSQHWNNVDIFTLINSRPLRGWSNHLNGGAGISWRPPVQLVANLWAKIPGTSPIPPSYSQPPHFPSVRSQHTTDKLFISHPVEDRRLSWPMHALTNCSRLLAVELVSIERAKYQLRVYYTLSPDRCSHWWWWRRGNDYDDNDDDDDDDDVLTCARQLSGKTSSVYARPK